MTLEERRSMVKRFATDLRDKELKVNSMYNLLASHDQSFNKRFSFSSQTKFGEVFELTLDFNDALTSYLVDLQYAINDDQNYFYRNFTGANTDSRLSLIRFFDNTVKGLYQGSMYFQSYMMSYINSRLNSIALTHGVILIAESLLIFLTAVALLRLIFAVMDSNQEVIKLFALIQQQEILALRKNCLNFINENLSHFVDEKEKNAMLNDDDNPKRLGEARPEEQTKRAKVKEDPTNHFRSESETPLREGQSFVNFDY